MNVKQNYYERFNNKTDLWREAQKKLIDANAIFIADNKTRARYIEWNNNQRIDTEFELIEKSLYKEIDNLFNDLDIPTDKRYNDLMKGLQDWEKQDFQSLLIFTKVG